MHPFASHHYRRPLHGDVKTDDHDLEAIFHAAVHGYGLATLPVSEVEIYPGPTACNKIKGPTASNAAGPRVSAKRPHH